MNGQTILASTEANNNDQSSSYLLPTTVIVTATLTMALATFLQLAFRKRKAASNKKAAKQLPSVDWTKYPNGEISVYFATQTGTAETFAKDLEREGADRGFLIHVLDLEDINSLEKLAPRCIFLTSVYGEGEPPDNAVQFTELLKLYSGLPVLNPKSPSAEPAKLLKQTIDYCVFGLGNRQYDHFNAIAKFFDEALSKIGGNRIVSLGLGDDDADIEADFETWKEKLLWPELFRRYGDVSVSETCFSVNTNMEQQNLSPPEVPIQVIYETQQANPYYDLPHDQIHTSSRHYFTAVDSTVTVIRQLQSKDSDNNTVHMELEGIPYQTADNLGVLPKNPTKLVDRVLERLGYDGDVVISIQPKENTEWHGAMFPQPDTLRNILTNYYDLQAPPRRSDLKLYSRYCKAPVDTGCLMRLASKEFRAEYKEKITNEFMGIVDLLDKTPSLQFPLEHFLHHIPLLQPRYFTIASSNKLYDSIHLTVAVTRHEKTNGDMFLGLCSNYMAEAEKQKLRVFVRPSTFRLPKDISLPIILIGPGTGVAPMRAFLQERSLQDANKRGKTILYFGCQKENKDYLYKEELDNYNNSGVIDNLRVAFSRAGGVKVYVQHLLQYHSEETADLIVHRNAHVYVCGAVQMGHDVNEVLQRVLHQKLPNSTAKEYLDTMSQQGRYVQELWA